MVESTLLVMDVLTEDLGVLAILLEAFKEINYLGLSF
jgi:hypothetical protein